MTPYFLCEGGATATSPIKWLISQRDTFYECMSCHGNSWRGSSPQPSGFDLFGCQESLNHSRVLLKFFFSCSYFLYSHFSSSPFACSCHSFPPTFRSPQMATTPGLLLLPHTLTTLTGPRSSEGITTSCRTSTTRLRPLPTSAPRVAAAATRCHQGRWSRPSRSVAHTPEPGRSTDPYAVKDMISD